LSVIYGEGDELRRGMEPEFLADVPPVIADGEHAQVQGDRDLLACFPLSDESENFFFFWR